MATPFHACQIRRPMTFGYVGYVWALIGCSFVMLFLGGIALVLYAIGKRTERGGARRGVVDEITLSPRESRPDSDERA